MPNIKKYWEEYRKFAKGYYPISIKYPNKQNIGHIRKYWLKGCQPIFLSINEIV